MRFHLYSALIVLAISALGIASCAPGPPPVGRGRECPSDQKSCDGECVPIDDPNTGCSIFTCTPCYIPNGYAECNEYGSCAVGFCNIGFADCDGFADNGCELDTRNDPENCGGCNLVCEGPNSITYCKDRYCFFDECKPGYANCDNTLDNGCEKNINTDATNCGACGKKCEAFEICSNGVCQPSGVCPESPCQLVEPQCGCEPDKACSIDSAGARSCIYAGNAPIGGECAFLHNCVAGSLCLTASSTVNICREFCSSDAQCTAPGGLCVVKMSDGNGGTIPDVAFCSEHCDASTNIGCVAGTACRFNRELGGQMRLFTSCSEAGEGMEGSSCTSDNDCAAGYGCINAGTPLCHKICKFDSPNCDVGQSCKALTIGADQEPVIIGAVKYGACI